MVIPPLEIKDQIIVEREDFQQLFTVLQSKGGYQVIGPTVRDHTIVYDTVTSVSAC